LILPSGMIFFSSSFKAVMGCEVPETR